MPIHDCLAVIEIPAEPAPEPIGTTPAVEQAIALAAATGAHLDVVVSAARMVVPSSPLMSGFAGSLAAEANARAKAVAETVAAHARDAITAAGLPATVTCELQALESAVAAAVAKARRHDLVIADHPHAALDTRGYLFQSLLFESGRPVLLAPDGRPPLARVHRVVLAWDGSSHAARALAGALHLFELTHMDIVAVTGEKALSPNLDLEAVARHVAHHGVEAHVATIPAAERSVAEVLEAHVAAAGADVLVMGGYGHSRWRQMLLGGVTRDLTERGRTPLLLAY